jgi:hypothetical protein
MENGIMIHLASNNSDARDAGGMGRRYWQRYAILALIRWFSRGELSLKFSLSH